MWYFERRILGKWWPCKGTSHPENGLTKPQAGSLRCIEKLPPEHHDLGLDDLAQLYGKVASNA